VVLGVGRNRQQHQSVHLVHTELQYMSISGCMRAARSAGLPEPGPLPSCATHFRAVAMLADTVTVSLTRCKVYCSSALMRPCSCSRSSWRKSCKETQAHAHLGKRPLRCRQLRLWHAQQPHRM